MDEECFIKEVEKIDYARQHDLTIKELRKYPIFSPFTDQQAQEIIATIKQFTRIVYDFYQKIDENPLN